MTDKVITLTSWRKTKKYLYDMRWFFIYSNGTVKRGLWTTSDPKMRASLLPRDGLLHVGIEVHNKITNEYEILTKADADEFKSFDWVGTVSIPAIDIKELVGTIKIKPSHEGLSLVKNDGSVFTFYVDGSIDNNK
jgi:hypothetical protein